MRKHSILTMSLLFILCSLAFAIVGSDVSRKNVAVDGHAGYIASWPDGVNVIWPDEDEVTVRVQVDNLTAAPTIAYVKHNGNTIDYGDISATQLDADSWVVEYVLIPLAVGHYECYVGNSGGTVVAADFWSAFS